NAASRSKPFFTSSRPVCMDPISVRLRKVVKPRSRGSSRCGYLLAPADAVIGDLLIVLSGRENHSSRCYSANTTQHLLGQQYPKTTFYYLRITLIIDP